MGRDYGGYGDVQQPQEPRETCRISMLLAHDEDGSLHKTLSLDGFLNGVPASFFLSNNSSHSFVRAQAMERAGLHFSSTARKRCQDFHIAGPDTMTLGSVVSPFRIQEYASDAFEFQVLPSIPAFDVVLGGDWMYAFGSLSFSRDAVSFPHNGQTITLHISQASRRITD